MTSNEGNYGNVKAKILWHLANQRVSKCHPATCRCANFQLKCLDILRQAYQLFSVPSNSPPLCLDLSPPVPAKYCQAAEVMIAVFCHCVLLEGKIWSWQNSWDCHESVSNIGKQIVVNKTTNQTPLLCALMIGTGMTWFYTRY